MRVTSKYFGKTAQGIETEIFTLENSNGFSANITNFGGIIVSLFVPDRYGKVDDIVLGYDRLEDYEKKGPYFGAIIGRHANRIENAVFEINGIEYRLDRNLGRHHLHGGNKGFDKAVWQAEIAKCTTGEYLDLFYTSRDGEEHYPGELNVRVTYSLTDDNDLIINYMAVPEKDTVLNLTNHSYFNLSGHDSGEILEHELVINADRFTVIGSECMPTGEIRTVEGTPLDFRKATPVGRHIFSTYEQIVYGSGYDHNWVLNVGGIVPEKVVKLYDPKSGRLMEVYTTKPGMQFFTPDFSKHPEKGKGSFVYDKRNGLCFETQYFPNGLKHKHFPSPIIKAGQEYNHTTIFKFSSN